METQDYLEAFKRILSQIKAMEAEINHILAGAPTVKKSIVEVQRGITKNSGSPMWRCTTSDYEKVNVFKHTDPDKNSFELFREAGYELPFIALETPGETDLWKQYPIEVEMRKVGPWWEVVKVTPRPIGAVPDVFDLTQGFDEPVTDESARATLDKLRSASLDLED